MSEFLKDIYDRIPRNLKFWYRLEMFVTWGLIILVALAYINVLVEIVTVGNETELAIISLVFLAPSYGIFRFIKSKKAKRKNEWKNYVQAAYKEKEFKPEVMAFLINELESSTKQNQSFAAWIAGIVLTLTILFVNLNITIILPAAQDALQDDLINSIDISNMVFEYILLISMVTGMSYVLLRIFSLKKKEVLLLLYDIRYKQLTDNVETEMKFSQVDGE